jgi:hypothetical protein
MCDLPFWSRQRFQKPRNGVIVMLSRVNLLNGCQNVWTYEETEKERLEVHRRIQRSESSPWGDAGSEASFQRKHAFGSWLAILTSLPCFRVSFFSPRNAYYLVVTNYYGDWLALCNYTSHLYFPFAAFYTLDFYGFGHCRILTWTCQTKSQSWTSNAAPCLLSLLTIALSENLSNSVLKGKRNWRSTSPDPKTHELLWYVFMVCHAPSFVTQHPITSHRYFRLP